MRIPLDKSSKFDITDFIGVFPESVDPNLCNDLCHYFERVEVVSKNSRRDYSVQDTRLLLDSFLPKDAKSLMEFVNLCLSSYVNEFPYLKDSSYISSLCLLQKTEPTQGYHMFHSENIEWNEQPRTMAWIVYLNDVPVGGETEFLYQKRKLKPQRGTVVIWPGSYTHLHRGNPPMSDKYIATGWYQGSTNLEKICYNRV